MKKGELPKIAAALLLLATCSCSRCSAKVRAGSNSPARFQYHPSLKFGVQARAVLLDTGSPQTGLLVGAQATGLTPGQNIHLSPIRRGFPGGWAGSLHTNRGSSEPKRYYGDQMFVGTWQVAPDGTGTLFAVKTGSSYVLLLCIVAKSRDDVGSKVSWAGARRSLGVRPGTERCSAFERRLRADCSASHSQHARNQLFAGARFHSEYGRTLRLHVMQRGQTVEIRGGPLVAS
jgi:hypothetical protein